MPSKPSRQKKPKKKKLLSQLSYHEPEPDITDLQVACLLQQDYNDSTDNTTITDIFGSSCSSSSVPFGHERILSPGSPSVDLDGDGLARRALRGREKWVFCRSSSDFDTYVARKGALSLKLDHEEVLTAWSDKGSLFIDGEAPQVVPELLENDHMEPNILVEVGNTAGWRVPEMDKASFFSWNRKERVMRYKAKRQSRLYSKRIRYEVRKLNAEKRPRIKGRFVKRTEDM